MKCSPFVSGCQVVDYVLKLPKVSPMLYTSNTTGELLDKHHNETAIRKHAQVHKNVQGKHFTLKGTTLQFLDETMSLMELVLNNLRVM